MISGIEELRMANGVLEECKEELLAKGVAFNALIPVGCMIEVPSAAMTADLLAKECDFLSIGTNDLVQYTLAVDRGNTEMSYLYKPSHLSVIRMLKCIIREGNLAGKPISVCGEIAADSRFIPLLLGLGVKELSVALPSLPFVKDVVRRTNMEMAAKLADTVCHLQTHLEVEEALDKAFNALR